MKNINTSLNKQKGNVTYLILVIISFIGFMGFEYYKKLELYDESNDFRSENIVNKTVEARIEYLKWFDNESTTDYYVFTSFGKLNIDAKSYGWNGDEDMYDDLEEYVGQVCTFQVESSWWFDWQTTGFNNCEFKDI